MTTKTSGPEPEVRLACTFGAFYVERYPDAVRLAHVITGDASIAEDLAQEAMLRVQARYQALRDPWPYTRVAIVNGARSHVRRRGREASRLAAVATTTGTSPAPAQPLELLDAIDRLPSRRKAVIVLRYSEDLSEEEIADALGCRGRSWCGVRVSRSGPFGGVPQRPGCSGGLPQAA